MHNCILKDSRKSKDQRRGGGGGRYNISLFGLSDLARIHQSIASNNRKQTHLNLDHH